MPLERADGGGKHHNPIWELVASFSREEEVRSGVMVNVALLLAVITNYTGLL